MQPASKANQRITRISAHLHPPNFLVSPLKLSSSSIVGRARFLISHSLSWWWHGIRCSFSMDGGELGVKACELPGIGRSAGFKVAILGAAGGIGQPLVMLMKINLLISVLHLYDVVNTPGVTADISHMDTGAVVCGFLGQQQLKEALVGMDLVIIPAGVPRKPGMTRDDLFNINAGIVRTLSEVFKRAGTYDAKRLLGVTTLDVVRANTLVAEVLGLDPREVDVPVVGGHAGVTILLLLSQVKPPCSFTPQEIEYLTSRIQNGGTEVVEAKAGAGLATLSMAHAAVKFADVCLRVLRGNAGTVECAFVASQVTELPFFASKVHLGRTGAEEVLPLGPLNEYERSGILKILRFLGLL